MIVFVVFDAKPVTNNYCEIFRLLQIDTNDLNGCAYVVYLKKEKKTDKKTH